VDAITGVLAKELGAKKIRVNSINPGMVELASSCAKSEWGNHVFVLVSEQKHEYICGSSWSRNC
jgi:NAD(P)-dependent dehydrogenase (short-subunit alcohol dehydrogenase family)